MHFEHKINNANEYLWFFAIAWITYVERQIKVQMLFAIMTISNCFFFVENYVQISLLNVFSPFAEIYVPEKYIQWEEKQSFDRNRRK